MAIPRPTWSPRDVEGVADIANCMKTYTNESRAFVIYSYGTTVVAESAMLHEDDAFHRTLQAAVTGSPDFRVMAMNDGNFLVRFAGPVCGLVLADHYKMHQSDIMANAASGGLLPGELFLTPQHLPIPESHYYVGLYARAKLYADVDALEIALRFTPGS
jgi:hypothetical protein